jgi:hypothetical protein
VQDFAAKLERFRRLVEEGQIADLKRRKLDCQGNLDGAKTTVVLGRKFSRVNTDRSGKYMVDNATGEIYGIKAYGVVHRGHRYGTLDTVDEWDWAGYVGSRKE